MPFGLRLFVKKRGSRRTTARLPSLLAEAALCIGLVGLGAYGMYWLISRELERATHGWWPWFALIIPLALIVYGLAALVSLLWQNVASSERRAAVAQAATDWDVPIGEAKSAHQTLPTVPPIDAVVDSAGVRLAYRLPTDAATGWMSAIMAAVGLVWNAFVVMFVVHVVRLHLNGPATTKVWLLTWLLVPFVLAGFWTLVALIRQVVLDIIIGTTRLEVSVHPFLPGTPVRGFVSQSGRLQVRWFQVLLVCEEQAVYQQGTDTRRATSRVFGDTLFSERKFEITPQRAFEAEFDFHVPKSAMHSFVSPHNAVVWTLVVRGRVARWGDFERSFPVFVYPSVPTSNSFKTSSVAAVRVTS